MHHGGVVHAQPCKIFTHPMCQMHLIKKVAAQRKTYAPKGLATLLVGFTAPGTYAQGHLKPRWPREPIPQQQ